MDYLPPRPRDELVDPELNKLTEAIIGACIEVHRVLGPGLLESMYEAALCRELDLRGIAYRVQVVIPVEYKEVIVGQSRLDLLVEERIIVELKACESLNPIHRAQLITYLKIMHLQLGLLINFNVAILKDGIKRVINSC